MPRRVSRTSNPTHQAVFFGSLSRAGELNVLSSLAKGFLVTTAFAPILLTFAFVEVLQEGPTYLAVVLVLGTAILVAGCVFTLRFVGTKFERLRFPITSVKAADTESVGYVVAYLLPLVNAGGPTVNIWVLVFVLFMFLVTVWGTNAYHFNPLLGILGYHFYEVTTDANVTFLLISPHDVRKSADVASVVQLTEYLVMVAED